MQASFGRRQTAGGHALEWAVVGCWAPASGHQQILCELLNYIRNEYELHCQLTIRRDCQLQNCMGDYGSWMKQPPHDSQEMVEDACRCLTCIQESVTRSGEDSGDWRGGGSGWISLGTTTSPLPITSIAPALFAEPGRRTVFQSQTVATEEVELISYWGWECEDHRSSLSPRRLWSVAPGQTVRTHPWHTRELLLWVAVCSFYRNLWLGLAAKM